MARPDYCLCDICKDKIPEDVKAFIETDRVCDGAGSMETVGENIELCAKCASKALMFITKPNFDLGTRLVDCSRLVHCVPSLHLFR